MMKKKKVVVLGAGISGLATAWKLSKNPDLEVLVIEKAETPGGWLQTDTSSGFLIEKAARTFKTSRCPELIDLALELGLKDKMIFSTHNTRYLWIKGKLVKAPSFSLLKKFMLPLLKEWSVAPHCEEETIWDFACRRFNKNVANYLFDPLVLGIYGGDLKTLSVNACFPFLKAAEKKWGSLTRAFFCEKKGKDASLFSFKGGIQTFVDTLASQSKAEFLYGEEVRALAFHADHIEVVTTKNKYLADAVFSALPSNALASIFSETHPNISALFSSIPLLTIIVVHVCYKKSVLNKRGFGYLVPSSEKEDILGVVFDSSIFEETNETRLTIMLRDSAKTEEEYKALGLAALQKHLHITSSPDFILVEKKEEAIPQYTLGHEERILLLQNRILKDLKGFHLVGNYLSGASVNQCIATAFSATAFWKSLNESC